MIAFYVHEREKTRRRNVRTQEWSPSSDHANLPKDRLGFTHYAQCSFRRLLTLMLRGYDLSRGLVRFRRTDG